MTSMSTFTEPPSTLLTLPSELRNVIYLYVFDPSFNSTSSDLVFAPASPGTLANAFKFDNRSTDVDPCFHNAHSSRRLEPLRTCRQIHQEAHLLALSLTPFHITGDVSYPDLFDLRSRPLSPAKIGAIRHLTLTARISHLRAMNEAWANLPFGHPSLKLETLTIVPKRPDCSTSAYAEVADLSQCHTLAYIFTETFKGLRNVKVVEVRNQGCFNDVVWRIVYRSLVYRLWRWGGESCGVRFECGPEGREGCDGWFKAHLLEEDGEGEKVGNEVGEEILRLAGGEMPDSDAPGVPF